MIKSLIQSLRRRVQVVLSTSRLQSCYEPALSVAVTTALAPGRKHPSTLFNLIANRHLSEDMIVDDLDIAELSGAPH